MIDTAWITVESRFKVTKPENFYGAEYNDGAIKVYWQIPKKGEIKPKIKITYNHYYMLNTLNIDIPSLPALIYGNNFYELNNSNFDEVLDTLQSKLLEMGVYVSIEDLKNAKLRRIDFCKNMYLPNDMPCNVVIKEITNAHLDGILKLRANSREHYGGGMTCRFFNKSQEDVFYNKGKQLKLDKNILRMECRLKNANTIVSKLPKAGIILDTYLFKDLFNEDISQKYLNYRWEMIKTGIPKAYDKVSNTELFCAISESNINKKLIILALKTLEKENRLDEVEKVLMNSTSKRVAKKLMKESRDSIINIDISISKAVEIIDEQIKAFNMIKPTNEETREKKRLISKLIFILKQKEKSSIGQLSLFND